MRPPRTPSRAAARFRCERLRVQRSAIDQLAAALPLDQLHVPYAAGRIDGAVVSKLARERAPMSKPSPAAPSLRSALDAATVVVCCGSGGVGKTTVAAALGVVAARRGRRVVVLTIDPAKRLADALGVDELGAEPARIDLDGDCDGELWAMMLDTAAAFTAVVRRYAGDAEQADRIVANPFFRNMAGSLSGTQEYMAAETLHLLAGDDALRPRRRRHAADAQRPRFPRRPGCARPLPRPSPVQAADAAGAARACG